MLTSGFQLTHPTRGATVNIYPLSSLSVYFNSHTPHGVRQFFICPGCTGSKFQLTHPTRGATAIMISGGSKVIISTHTPHTGCDDDIGYVCVYVNISTHTPHTGCDETENPFGINARHFNSHTPHGVRLTLIVKSPFTEKFQLTHPTRGATGLLLFGV